VTLKVVRIGGYLLQSLVLGTLLAMAIVKMAAMAGGATVFRYEGF
jgi:hypothetical protein